MPGEYTRPTADRVKESLFNILAARIPGCYFADFFSGSGSVGCEALSRGAERVVFIDSQQECRKIILNNINRARFSDRAEVLCEDFKSSMRKIGKQDIIFLDPPYHKNLGVQCLEMIAKCDILKSDGIAVLEHDFSENIPEIIAGLIRYDMRKYGRAGLSFYIKEASGEI